MKNLLITVAIGLTSFGIASTASATGAFQCEATDRADWLSEAELEKVVADLDWTLRRFKSDGGCWEVYATMNDGTRMEAYLHPVSGEVQYISQRGRVLFNIRDGEAYESLQ